jgi:3-hydroxyisobutyrate dehydrogenase
MSHVAFIGTGLLGGNMVQRMRDDGHEVTVWNRTEQKARALEACGAVVARTPEDAVAGVERVHMTLTDDAVVDGVLERIVPRLQKGAIVIDHSTTSPSGTRGRAERLQRAGVRFIHAPVFMSPQMCREGGGLMLVSAPRPDFDAVHAALERMTGEVWYVSDRPDVAAVYKLCGNAMLFAVTGGLADVCAIAKGSDVEPADALTVFTKFMVANSILMRGGKMVRGDFSPSFELAMARKDVRLMLEAADGFPLVVLPAIARRMDEAIADGHGSKDLAAVGADVIAGDPKTARR